MNIIIARLKKANVPNIADNNVVSNEDAMNLIKNSEYKELLSDNYIQTYDNNGTFGIYGLQELNARAILNDITPLICICELYEFTNVTTKEAETIAITHIVRSGGKLENPQLTYYNTNSRTVKNQILSNGIIEYAGRRFITNKDLDNINAVVMLNKKLKQQVKENVKL